MKFKKSNYKAQVDQRDCGIAALAMILKNYGSEKSLASLRMLARTDMEGTSALGIKRAAEALDFDVRAINANMTLFKMTKVPYPFIAHIIKKQKYPHYYVITGADEKNIYIADPDPSVKFAKIDKDSFVSEWTGLALFIAPKPEYKPSKEKPSSLFDFIPILSKQKKLVVNILIASFLVTFINIVGAYYLQNIIDTYVPNVLNQTLGIISIALIFTYIIQQGLQFAQTFLLNVLGQRLAIEIILSYVRHLFELPMSFFSTRRTGEITSRFSDANTILNALASSVMSLFLDLTVIVLTGIVLSIQNIQLFLLVLVSIPLYIVIVLIFVKLFEKQNDDTMQANAILSSSIIEDLNGIETIKALASEETRYQKIDHEFTDYLIKAFELQRSTTLQTSIKSSLQLLLNVGILWTGALLVMRQNITLGQLITFNALLTYFTNPLTNIINLQTILQQARVANNRLNEVYLVESEFLGNDKAEIPKNYELKLSNVFYKYGFGKNILTDISLDIQENEKVTIVGMSGSGKTTLVKLLVNFFVPTTGSITLGKYDIQNLDKQELRRRINYLPQRPYIFTGTVLENITLGSSVYKKDMIENAVNIAEIKSDIEQMELGYQTQLSSEATNLSGGQKQRLH